MKEKIAEMIKEAGAEFGESQERIARSGKPAPASHVHLGMAINGLRTALDNLTWRDAALAAEAATATPATQAKK